MKKPSILKRFRDDQRGSAYVMAALSIVPLLGMTALAVDYTNHDRMTTDLETAAETVALHIAKRVALDPNTSASDFVAEGKEIFAALIDDEIIYEKFDVDTTSGKVQLVAKLEVDTHFMHMFGHDTLSARTQTEARFGRLNVDVALGIDNSGSMGGTISDGSGGTISKIDAAKKAAKLLVKTASASVEDLSNTNLRFSIVPWHSHVSLPHSELRTGASESDPVDQGTWASWIDWEGYSEGHFAYLAPYIADGGGGNGDPYWDFGTSGDSEWETYDPKKLRGKLDNASVMESDDGGVNVQALRDLPNIGVVTRKDVFKNTNTTFNGCFEHRHGNYRFSFDPATTSTYLNPAEDPNFNGNSLYVPNMAPDELDGSSGRNDYIRDTGGVSDHTQGFHENGSSGSGSNVDDHRLNGEYARVMNSAKYVNIKTTGGNNDLWTDHNDNPNGSCNTAKVLPLNDDVDGITNTNANGDIAVAINNMDDNGFTDQSIGLEWAMNSLTPWAPLPQGGEFDETQKIIVFMTDGFNETRNKHDYEESYMSFQYPTDDIWNVSSGSPSGTQIDKAINDATKLQCDLIKARGVKIYYIYFGTPNADATAVKDHCASTPESAIEATNAAQLEAAFEKIGDDIGRLRLTHYSD